VGAIIKLSPLLKVPAILSILMTPAKEGIASSAPYPNLL
jgi:hypothetical protein